MRASAGSNAASSFWFCPFPPPPYVLDIQSNHVKHIMMIAAPVRAVAMAGVSTQRDVSSARIGKTSTRERGGGGIGMVSVAVRLGEDWRVRQDTHTGDNIGVAWETSDWADDGSLAGGPSHGSWSPFLPGYIDFVSTKSVIFPRKPNWSSRRQAYSQQCPRSVLRYLQRLFTE